MRKCPICGEELDVYDIDYNFEGNQDEYADCDHCHHSFIFYIRYHHLWKYTQWDLIKTESNDWVSDETTEKTIIVYKGGKK